MADPPRFHGRHQLDELLLNAALDQTEDHAVVLMDARGIVVGWLCGSERIFGYTADEIVGQRLDLLFTPEDRRLGIPDLELAIAAKDGRAEDDRWQLRKDGTRVWMTGSANALRDLHGNVIGFIKVARDRTDLRGQLDALENQVAALTKTHEHQRIFLSKLSHELRNPLATLVGAVQLLQITESSSPDFTDATQMIERQVDAIRRLVDDLTEASRIGAGKARLDAKTIDLKEAVTRAVESCRWLVDERRHTLEVILPRGPIFLEADMDRLQQILINLINNAAKYTDDGGFLWVKATVEDDEAVVRVRDSGVGITHEMLPHIFELFTQAETTLPKAAGGLGIGLSLVKELVTMHHGSVQVRSEGQGKGSEFTVRLPLVQPEFG